MKNYDPKIKYLEQKVHRRRSTTGERQQMDTHHNKNHPESLAQWPNQQLGDSRYITSEFGKWVAGETILKINIIYFYFMYLSVLPVCPFVYQRDAWSL